MRSDARRNRERVLAAAAEAFAERGLDAAVDDIARRAGVGVGTVYRRFPTKEALVDALVAELIDELVAAAEQARDTSPPAEGFAAFLTTAGAVQAARHGYLSQLWTTREVHAEARARLRSAVGALLDTAQQAGAVRADVVYEDVPLLLWSLGALIEATEAVAPGTWRRAVELTVQGLGGPVVPLSVGPLTAEQLAEVAAHQPRASRRP